MSKAVYLLVVIAVVFHLSTVADASFASTWEEAKSKVIHIVQDAGKVAEKAVTAIKNLFTGSNHEKPAAVTPKPASPVTTESVTSPAESRFVKSSARNSESSGRSSYSHPYGTGSGTYGSAPDQGFAGFGQWSSAGRSAYGSKTHETTTSRTYGYGSGTYGSASDQGFAGFGEWTSSGRSAYGSRNHEPTTAQTSGYGWRNGGQYSDDWTSSSGNGRSNNYGSSSYSKGSPYSDTYWFSEE